MRIPTATYRLQFNSAFTFKDAQNILDYLSALGISDVYASPIFKVRSGSSHGYDIVDPHQINPELGGIDGFEEIIRSAVSHNLGWLQDIVPNHMAYDSENKILMDILENGPLSKFYNFFDIEWEHPYENLRGKVLTPFLGEFYGNCLDKMEIKLSFGENGLCIKYYSWTLPLRIDTYLKVLNHNLSLLEDKLGRNNNSFIKFLEITQILKDLASVTEPDERYRQITLIKAVLWKLYLENEAIKEYLHNILKTYNGNKKEPESFNQLDKLLTEQSFRLSFWKVGNEELNYRRFFTVNELICLKTEQPEVFNYTHKLILKLLNEGKITGLRVDHIDGLFDPFAYLQLLRENNKDAYLVVEKILDLKEDLPPAWPVQGTTGYDFLNFVNAIFVEKNKERMFTRIYLSFTGMQSAYTELLSDKKRLFMGKHMAGDIDNLAHLMKNILNRNRYGKDITMYGLKRALVEIMAQFPVYRTYIRESALSDIDKKHVKEAAAKAKQRNHSYLYELNFIEKVLLLDFDANLKEEEKNHWIYFAKRFQQFSCPLMAKGAEDTAFYIYNRLISLNDVGGNPSKFGLTVAEFHEFQKKRNTSQPQSLNATSTHDTKRGEDARARLNVLSEIPREWVKILGSSSKINRPQKTIVAGAEAPSKNDEYLLYQTIIAALPFDRSDYPAFQQRLKDYMVKAIREAKIHTAWIKPDTEYEDACTNFISRIFSENTANNFLAHFIPFQKKIAYYGMFNSLSQTLLKLTCSGVPDLYQGAELWDLNLVDPDNRRPVDFERRKELLRQISDNIERTKLLEKLLNNKEDGRMKLFLIQQALAARQRHQDLFSQGEYLPLEMRGKYRQHIIAFARKHNNSFAITVVPRFLTKLIKEGENPLGKKVWQNTMICLPDNNVQTWKNIFTGQQISRQNYLPASEILELFPTALLINE